MRRLIRTHYRAVLAALGLMAGLAVVCAVASCGGPEEPQQRSEPGALGKALGAQSVAVPHAAPAKPVPYVVIRFDRPGIAFQDALYSAMSRALDRYPAAEFDIVLAMPPLTKRADPNEALRRGEQHIEDVVLAMTDMGLPSARLRIAASTDITATVDEIRIFVR